MTRRRLDREKIVSAAIRLSVVTDPDAMSFRKIGAELGVDPTAIYRHFRSRSDLVAATLDALWSRTVQRIPPELEWRPRLEHIGAAFYDVIQSHPAVGVEAGHRTTGGPGELAAVQMVLEALGDAGLSPRDVVRLYPVYSGVVLSMASAQAAYELAGGELSSASSRAWLADHLSPEPEQFPAVHKYAGDLERISHRDVFDLSLEMVLDTISAAV